MRVAIEMPKLSFQMDSGVIQGWRKQVGEPVAKGEIVADIETEKVTVGLESPATGILVEIVHGPGDEVPAHTSIAWLDAAS
jgi:pyruvate dehydrogenase E2 component (dihydrolipoamide acetyltransferase)